MLKGQAATLSGIIGVVIAVMIAAILLMPSAGVISSGTAAQVIAENESITAVAVSFNASTLYDNIVSGTEVVTNSTDGVIARDVQYHPWYSAGVMTFNETGTWNITYSYYADTYITDAMTRNIITFVLVIIVVVIIAFLGMTVTRSGV